MVGAVDGLNDNVAIVATNQHENEEIKDINVEQGGVQKKIDYILTDKDFALIREAKKSIEQDSIPELSYKEKELLKKLLKEGVLSEKITTSEDYKDIIYLYKRIVVMDKDLIRIVKTSIVKLNKTKDKYQKNAFDQQKSNFDDALKEFQSHFSANKELLEGLLSTDMDFYLSPVGGVHSYNHVLKVYLRNKEIFNSFLNN